MQAHAHGCKCTDSSKGMSTRKCANDIEHSRAQQQTHAELAGAITMQPGHAVVKRAHTIRTYESWLWLTQCNKGIVTESSVHI